MISSQIIFETVLLTVLKQNKNENNIEILLNRVKDAAKFVCKKCGCPVVKKRIIKILWGRDFWIESRVILEAYLSWKKDAQKDFYEFLEKRSFV